MNSPNFLPLLGEIPANWQIVEFGKVLQDGQTRNGIYKPKQYHGTGVKIVNMGEIFAYSRVFNVPMQRLEVTPDELKKYDSKLGIYYSLGVLL